MKIEIHLLRFYARVWDPESETNREVPITLTKDQLRAAGLLEMSSKEVISRICKRWGFQLLEAGKAERRTIAFNLDSLWDSLAGGETQGAPLDPIEMMGALEGVIHNTLSRLFTQYLLNSIHQGCRV